LSRSDEIRSHPQNRRLHAMIRDISEQVEWAGEFMDEETWKLLLLAAAYGQRFVPNPLDPQAPFLLVNVRRSRGLVVPEMADLITQIVAFGNERGREVGSGGRSGMTYRSRAHLNLLHDCPCMCSFPHNCQGLSVPMHDNSLAGRARSELQGAGLAHGRGV
jgi:hypothetical protein